MTTKCPPFWFEKPDILVKQALDFFPFHSGAQQCTTTALNSFTRFGVYLGIVLAVLTGKMVYLLLSVGIAGLAVAAFYGMKDNGSIREGFQAGFGSNWTPPAYPSDPEANLVAGSDAADEVVDDIIGRTVRTEPSAANPFMNVLLTEIGDTPQRPPAANGVFLKRQFANHFSDRVYGDPNDVFQKTQDQRVWVVQPNTSIPNDQESFQNWLYRTPGRTCKEGNTRACKPATDGGQLTYLSVA